MEEEHGYDNNCNNRGSTIHDDDDQHLSQAQLEELFRRTSSFHPQNEYFDTRDAVEMAWGGGYYWDEGEEEEEDE